MGQAIELREAAYWDQQVSRLGDSDLCAERVSMDRVTQCRMRFLGDVQGQRVLDVGCGSGLWSVFLAQQGAEVWAIDISERSVAATLQRARLQGLEDRAHALVMSATQMQFADGFFDCVHGSDVIHHVDAALLGREVARVLVPNGRAVFCENSANNPVLMLARRYLCGRWGIPKWSSEDEYPLTRRKRAQFGQFFQQTQVEYPEFFFFHLLDAKLFGYRNRWVNRSCRGADEAIYRFLPFMRPYSYRQVICCRQPLSSPG